MKLTKFQINEDPIFQGFSDGSTWNGWNNPYFTLEVAKEVLNYYQNQAEVTSSSLVTPATKLYDPFELSNRRSR